VTDPTPRLVAQAADPRLGSPVYLLCTFRLCDWHSEDVHDFTPAEQDEIARAHLAAEHRDTVRILAERILAR
jgi:hypothetical protein